jgi:Na+-translocating ferredoxin:NAD+ oxidoreductase RnfG subunit
MIKKIVFLSLLVLFCNAFSIPEKIAKKADKEIAKFYETEDFKKLVIFVPEELNNETPSQFGDENLFKISSKGKLVGYGYIGNAPSRTARFDYLVLFDTDLILAKIKVLVYREEYGGEIGSKRWLEQFDGTPVASKELRLNQEIVPISGATISTQAMTKAINDLLKSISLLHTKKIL